MAIRGFLDRFYDIFFASDPRVASFFTYTNLHTQKHMLRQGLTSLIMYVERRGMSEVTVRRLRDSHGPGGLGIPYDLYDQWQHSLLQAVEEFDGEFTSLLRMRWARVLTPGLSMMRGNALPVAASA